MNLIKAIYNAPIITKDYDESIGTTKIEIRYENRTFRGWAALSPEDKEFYSKKVGYNIALSKARINALEYYCKQEEKKYKQRFVFLQEVLGYGKKELAEIDPTNAFSRGVMHCKSRVVALEAAAAKEKEVLKKYIEGQDKAIVSIKNYRKANNN